MKSAQVSFDRMNELCASFSKYLNSHNKNSRIDSPGTYFHIRTIEILNKRGIKDVFNDSMFFDYLYATIATWGMATRSARLVGFADFKASICKYKEIIIELGSSSLITLAASQHKYVDCVTDEIWQLITDMHLSETDAQLVTGSKTLHHLLPNLVPPIDRKYTIKFFDATKDERHKFSLVFSGYRYIYDNVSSEINESVKKGTVNTSITKVIDNAIIGYQKAH